MGPFPIESEVRLSSEPQRSEPPVQEPDLVFNIVWTGAVFPYLRLFVASQIAHSAARFRFVLNGCAPDQLGLMEEFASRQGDRIVEVLDVSAEMIPHGRALDIVRARRQDGPLFCMIDPDIKANAPFVPDLVQEVGGDCAAVTSGKEVWSDGNLLPPGHPGVAGEHFFGRDGFVYGSPHLAIYRRDLLDEVCDRWGIGLGSGGDQLRDHARAQLEAMGRTFLLYDTAKLVNIFLQADGHRLVHRDLDQIVHIGGLSHYLAPTGYRRREDGEMEPNWARWPGDPTRYEVAHFTARTLRALSEGEPPPPAPEGTATGMAARLEVVLAEVADLVQRYR